MVPIVDSLRQSRFISSTVCPKPEGLNRITCRISPKPEPYTLHPPTSQHSTEPQTNSQRSESSAEALVSLPEALVIG